MKSGRFGETEHQVHILQCLSGCALEQIIDGAGNKQFPVFFLEVNEAFIGIDHLFEIQGLRTEMNKGIVTVEFFKKRLRTF